MWKLFKHMETEQSTVEWSMGCWKDVGKFKNPTIIFNENSQPISFGHSNGSSQRKIYI
jgi:hypothetical protein